MNENMAKAIVALGICIVSGLACVATHSAEPMWVIVILLFLFFLD